jgi:CheY-like chemotaxis protein
MLSTMLHQVTEAGSGEEAIAALKQNEFDVLITDLSLECTDPRS